MYRERWSSLRIRGRQRVNRSSARDRRRNYRGGRRQGRSTRRSQTACTLRLHSRQFTLQRKCRRRRKVLRWMLQVMSRRQRHAGNIGLAARGGRQQQAKDGMTQKQPLAQCFHDPLFLCQVVRRSASLRRSRRPVKRDKLREAGESRPPGVVVKLPSQAVRNGCAFFLSLSVKHLGKIYWICRRRKAK